ncbi:hypothetical protein TIFTF001_030861 [Ficus carica]|uniref:Uncharacterized protein n=1 Tax=Ficus carica TaxID=3494 RepID=A0AA88DUI4_FICCA|nr:hypothetical protein TIFTF001_030861 [Ficus carica]
MQQNEQRRGNKKDLLDDVTPDVRHIQTLGYFPTDLLGVQESGRSRKAHFDGEKTHFTFLLPEFHLCARSHEREPPYGRNISHEVERFFGYSTFITFYSEVLQHQGVIVEFMSSVIIITTGQRKEQQIVVSESENENDEHNCESKLLFGFDLITSCYHKIN